MRMLNAFAVQRKHVLLVVLFSFINLYSDKSGQDDKVRILVMSCTKLRKTIQIGRLVCGLVCR